MSKTHHPLKAVLLFLLIAVVLPFYESERVIRWSSLNLGQQEQNIIEGFLLKYAEFSEGLKNRLGLSQFFEREKEFWTYFSQSPIIFQNSLPTSETEAGQAVNSITTIANQAGTYIDSASSSLDFVQNPSSTENTSVSDKAGSGSKAPKTIPMVTLSASTSLSFLLVGDSFIKVYGGVGDVLESELLRYKNVEVKREGVVSSGLSRPDYFDWQKRAKELILGFRAKIVVVMLGTNDAQSFQMTTKEGKLDVYVYGTEKWKQEYAKRAADFLNIFSSEGIIVYWLGMPIMRDKSYSDRMKGLNEIYQKAAENSSSAFFISTWDMFSDKDGNYISSLANEKGIQMALRASDGIHLTRFAGNMVVDKLIKKIQENIPLELR